MNYRYVLDSYAWVEYIIGTPMGRFVQLFLEMAEQCYTPSIVIAELSTKFERENKRKEWEIFFKFIKNKSSIIPLDSELANQSGIMKIKLRAKEKTIGLADAIIYQTAINLNASLITGDKHFEHFPEIIYLKDSNRVKTALNKFPDN